MSDRSNAYLENGFAGHTGTMEDSLERFNISTGVCSIMYPNTFKVDSVYMERHKERNKWDYDSAEYALYVGLSGIKYLRVLSDIEMNKESSRKEKCWKKLEYITSYKGQYISFEFECRKDKCDDFEKVSQEVMNSVVIEDLLTYTTSWK